MAEDRMALLETVRKAIGDGDVDFLREGMRVLAEAVMEAEVSEVTGLPHGERDPDRRLRERAAAKGTAARSAHGPHIRYGRHFAPHYQPAAPGPATTPPLPSPGKLKPPPPPPWPRRSSMRLEEVLRIFVTAPR